MVRCVLYFVLLARGMVFCIARAKFDTRFKV